MSERLDPVPAMNTQTLSRMNVSTSVLIFSCLRRERSAGRIRAREGVVVEELGDVIMECFGVGTCTVALAAVWWLWWL